MAYQTIKTPGGETLVVLPIEEFRKLQEAAQDAVDATDAERAQERVQADELETLTSDEVLALADAPTPLAFWRKKRGLTQVALAEQVGVTQGYLSSLEAGKRQGDVGVVRKLAEVLRVRMEDLVDD